MEDFGYSNQKDETAAGAVVKRAFLIGATLFSVACFVYVTINAYYFIYNEKNNNIETIKAAADPLKVMEEQESEQKSMQVDSSIYEDIFGNKKRKEKEIKLRETAETALPPKVKDVEEIDKKPAVKNAAKSGQIIVYSDKEPESDNKILLNQKTSPKSNENIEAAAQKPAARSLTASKNKKYVRVQIAALTSKNSANDYWENLQKLYPSLFSGLKYFAEEANLGKRGIFYRVQVGNFFDQIRAEEFCNKYVAQTKKSKADCIVVE